MLHLINELLVDTHSHLDMPDFDADRDQIIARALEAGVSNIITVGTDLKSSQKAIELSGQYFGVYAAVGIHPQEAANGSEGDTAVIRELARNPRVVAIGETGLDFYRNETPKPAQIQALKWHLALSAELGLPVIIHCRQAAQDMLEVLHSTPGQGQYRGVIHCFSGDSETLKEYLNMGFYISLGAYIGYPSSKGTHDVIRSIPMDRALVETDSPFLPPQSKRGKRNEPAYVAVTARVLADIMGESYERIANVTTENAQRLFSLG